MPILVHNNRMSLESRVGQLYVSSERILDECALSNGAIIAADTEHMAYPSTAENYRFSWARDAAYQLLAAHALNPQKAKKRAVDYSGWLQNVWGFNKTGLYIKRYGTNGALDVRYGEQHQPDQAGTLIGALDTVVPEPNQKIDSAIEKMADGLVDKWDGGSFGPTQDLWENRETTHENGAVFTYTIASVIYGLRHAINRLKGGSDTDRWQKVSNEMISVFNNGTAMDPDGSRYYVRSIYPNSQYHDPDNTIDASLAGLAYPFSQPEFNSDYITSTIKKINNQLYSSYTGVSRYYGDTYDGIVRTNGAERRAGGWPLLSFWQSIALHTIDKKDQAKDQYFQTIDRLDFMYKNDQLPDNMIPEQSYRDSYMQGRGVLPLAWSHAKFILATKTLDILN